MPQESYAIHRSACNRDSRNFAFPEFSEVGTEVRLVASCLLWRGISRCRCSGSRLLTSSRKGVQINPQTIARVTGILFLITFATSIPPFVYHYVPVLDDPRYIVGGGGADNRVLTGAFLELILIIANIGAALVLFPILRR